MGGPEESSLRQVLRWVPLNNLKKVFILLVVLIIVLCSTVNIEIEYYTWRNRVDIEVSDLKMITTGPPSLTPAASKYGMYMYLGCTASPFASVLWHVTQAVKVCDLSSSHSMCNVKMKKDYSYDELALKAMEWLQSDHFSQMLDQNEVIVKLDDDTIISKDILDSLVENFVKSDCKFAGAMRQSESGLYWSSGPLMLIKADFLKERLQNNGHVLQYNRKYEDVQMSSMLDLRDRKSVCNIDTNVFKHRYYEDGRMAIRFKSYVKC